MPSQRSPANLVTIVLAVTVLAVTAGCGNAGASAAAGDSSVDSWSPPPAWVAVSSNNGSIEVTLPPWLRAFDRTGAIFANEPPPAPGAQIPMELLALGPGTDDGLRPGEDLLSWVERRLDSPVRGVPTVVRVTLPAGAGIRYDRVDGAATAAPWRIVVYAIQTPRGAAWLQFDGPVASWPQRAEDLAHVALTFQVR